MLRWELLVSCVSLCKWNVLLLSFGLITLLLALEILLQTTYFYSKKVYCKRHLVGARFAHHKLQKYDCVFPLVQRKHFPWDISQKGIHCGCKPGLAKRNSLNIFFPGQKHTTYYYYSTRKLFFQINTGAQRSSIVVTFIGGLYYRKCPNTNKAAMFVLTTLLFVCKLGKKSVN